MVVTLCLVIMGACGKATDNGSNLAEGEVSGITFIDALDREVTVNHPKKVAALMGSFADVWLLAGGELAAITEDAFDKKNIELDDKVVNLGIMTSPDVERLIDEKIDFVILSSNTAEHVELMDTLEAAGINCAYFNVETFDDYLTMLKICTDITGDKTSYKKNGEDVEESINSTIESKPEGISPTVLFLRAFSTGVKAKGSNSMVGTMLKDLGGVNIVDSENSLLEDLNMEKIIKEDPDYVFVVTMGSSEEKALETVKKTLISNPAWKELSAVKNDRYIVLPKDLFHLKPNARWGESYEMLAKILYEEE